MTREAVGLRSGLGVLALGFVIVTGGLGSNRFGDRLGSVPITPKGTCASRPMGPRFDADRSARVGIKTAQPLIGADITEAAKEQL
jgi:hypothetical protein